MRKRRRYSDETKAAVVAAIMAGQSTSEISQEFDIPESTIDTWKAQMDSGIIGEVREKKKENFGELLGNYLRENLITLESQSHFFRNPEWLKTQSAADLAILHGVTADKAIRILAALEPDSE